jgi:creatinine amidohydrolase
MLTRSDCEDGKGDQAMGYSIFEETMVDLAWPEIEAAIKRKAILLLPVGVIEEHGPHMGLAVDIYTACMVARLAKQQLESRGIQTLIAPPFYWGINGFSARFAGSFSVRPETMKAVLLDTMASLKNWGVNYVFLLNCHGEGKHNLVILEAVKEARALLILKAYYIVPDIPGSSFGLSGQEDYVLLDKTTQGDAPSPYLDIHAGSGETAVMLNYFPRQVNVEITKTLKPTRITGEDLKALRKSGEETSRMIPQGYIGDPAGFDIEAGKREVEEKALRYAVMIEKVVKGNQ